MDRKKRRRQAPPARLAWPTPSQSNQEDTKQRQVTFQQPSTELWSDLYSPKSTKDLCVAPKKLKEIDEWMDQAISRTSNSRLLILIGRPGIGKSTAVRVLADERQLRLLEWTERISAPERFADDSMEHETPLTSFETFLKQSSVGFSSLASHSPTPSLILLDELPYRHGVDAEQRFRNLLTAHVRQSATPTILIWSNVVEGRHRPEDLERILDRSWLYSQAVDIVQIHPPTKARFKKALERCATHQRMQLSSNRCEELYNDSGGDVRFAFNKLQFQGACGSWSRAPAEPARDEKLNTFHALGKLLYAKRLPASTAATSIPSPWNDGRPPMDFDPERVVERSDMELSGALSFLEYHCIDFFSDITELSAALSSYSDAAFLLDRPMDGRQEDGLYPKAYAGSLAGRAVACFNVAPAPTKFRQFTAPKVFDVWRKRRNNQGQIQQLHRRLALSSCTLSMSSLFGGMGDFAADGLPYIRRLVPEIVGGSLDALQSFFRSSTTDAGRDKEDEAQALWREQQEILEQDDIGDFDDDDDYAARPNPTAVKLSADGLSNISPTSVDTARLS